jgi:hypothetical protein
VASITVGALAETLFLGWASERALLAWGAAEYPLGDGGSA